MENAYNIVNETLNRMYTYTRHGAFNCFEERYETIRPDHFAEGRVKFFMHGTLIIEMDGRPVHALAGYHGAADVLFLSDLFRVVYQKEVLEAVIKEMVMNGNFAHSDQSGGIDRVLLLDGRFCHRDRNGVLLKYFDRRVDDFRSRITPKFMPHQEGEYHDCFGDDKDTNLVQVFYAELDRLHQFLSREYLCDQGLSHELFLIEKRMRDGETFDRALAEVVPDHVCLHCVNKGRRPDEWGGLVELLPSVVCPNCGRVVLDTTKETVMRVIDAAANEVSRSRIRALVEGHSPKGSKTTRSKSK